MDAFAKWKEINQTGLENRWVPDSTSVPGRWGIRTELWWAGTVLWDPGSGPWVSTKLQQRYLASQTCQSVSRSCFLNCAFPQPYEVSVWNPLWPGRKELAELISDRVVNELWAQPLPLVKWPVWVVKVGLWRSYNSGEARRPAIPKYFRPSEADPSPV